MYNALPLCVDYLPITNQFIIILCQTLDFFFVLIITFYPKCYEASG
jgi:hypothetical protein